MWAEHQFARQRAGSVGRRDANEDMVGKGRRHCQRSGSSRESPVFVGAARIYARLRCADELEMEGDAVLGSHARRRPSGPAPVPAPRQRALNRALARRAMETGRRGRGRGSGRGRVEPMAARKQMWPAPATRHGDEVGAERR
jgi:hypothetical protein